MITKVYCMYKSIQLIMYVSESRFNQTGFTKVSTGFVVLDNIHSLTEIFSSVCTPVLKYPGTLKLWQKFCKQCDAWVVANEEHGVLLCCCHINFTAALLCSLLSVNVVRCNWQQRIYSLGYFLTTIVFQILWVT